jgi:hypothetical protein
MQKLITMKKQFQIFFTGVLMLGGGCIYAQDTIPIKTLPPVTITATHKNVPQKVWRNFREYFSDTENPSWYMVNKDFLIKFMTDDNLNHALFTKRGNLVYHISYGYEKNLPEDIRRLVKSSYYDYNIIRAIKVTEANRLIWIVNLEDARNLILVRLEEGELEEVQKIEKS